MKISRRAALPFVDARPLRIGALGLSDGAELRLIEPLSRAALPVHPIRIRLGTARETAAELASLRGAAVSFTRAILDEPLDGLVLTGSPTEQAPVDDHPSFRELAEILEYARGFVPSTLGLGSGGLVLARALDLELSPLAVRVDGMVPQRVVDRDHPLLRGSSEVFFALERRRFRVTDDSLRAAVARGRVTPIARSRDAGVSIFESGDRRFVAHLGHPEHEPSQAAETRTAFLDSARTSAQAHADGFFAAWIEQVYRSARSRR